mgnify:CR=1 FL=1
MIVYSRYDSLDAAHPEQFTGLYPVVVYIALAGLGVCGCITSLLRSITGLHPVLAYIALSGLFDAGGLPKRHYFYNKKTWDNQDRKSVV